MAKDVKGYIKLQINGGQANPAPPVGPALGQYGVPIQEFTSQFNDRTKDKMGVKLPVIITVYEDRTFDFIVKQPPMSTLIKDILKLKKGSGVPQTDKVGHLTLEQVKEVAEAKIIQIASTGSHIVKNTVVRINIPAHGIPAAHTDAKITINTMVNWAIIVKSIHKTCATKIATHAWYNAVPSILIVVQIGNVKSTTSFDKCALFLATLIDSHIVALLDAVEKPTRIASFTFRKYLKGLKFPIIVPISGRLKNAWINKAKSITATKGRRLIILSTQFSYTTFATMANTPNGVSFITKLINFKIPVFRVSISACRASVSLFFQIASTEIHKIIPVETICIAFKSTNAWKIFEGIKLPINDENVNFSIVSGLNSLKPKFNPTPGSNMFIKIRETEIANVVVSI